MKKLVSGGGMMILQLLLVGQFRVAAQDPNAFGSLADPQGMADELNRVQGLSPDAARETAAALRAVSGHLSGETLNSTRFLLAVASERAGDSTQALALYEVLTKLPRGNKVGEAAFFRETVLSNQSRPLAEREAAMNSVLGDSDVQSWFPLSGRWVWSDKHTAARQALVDMRSTQLSFVLFSFLRKNSPWQGPLAFLGILGFLSLGAKILELPLLVRSAKLTGQLAALQPEIRRIEAAYAHAPQEKAQQLMQLYSTRGVSLTSGCLMSVADMAFVIWAFIAMADFRPQMALDRSALWWISDVTKPDNTVLMIWVLFSTLHASTVAQTGQRAQAIGAAVVSAIGFSLIAYFWKWPAYVFIYWILLSAVGTVSTLLLWPVRRAAERATV